MAPIDASGTAVVEDRSGRFMYELENVLRLRLAGHLLASPVATWPRVWRSKLIVTMLIRSDCLIYRAGIE